MIRFLTSVFSEPGGGPSSTRLMTAFIVGSVVGTWTWVSLTKNELQKLDPEHVFLVGCAMGFKVWQRGKEGSQNTTTMESTRTVASSDTKPPF